MKLEVSSLKINTTKTLSRFGAPLMPSIYEKRHCLSEFLQEKFIFGCFFVILAHLMRFSLTGRIYREKTCLNTNTEPCDWICFPKYCFNNEILVTAFLLKQISWIQNAYFLIENCLPRPSQIKFDASTPSESVVVPKSLQSRTLLSWHKSKNWFRLSFAHRQALVRIETDRS